MADISKITLPTGTTYDIKDATARSLISNMSNYTAYLGVTTTALADGSTTATISINGSNVTAATGNIVTYQKKELIFNGEAWQEFGDLSGLGSLAYKGSASGSFTPSGSVSQPTFTGTAHSHTASFAGTKATITPTITADASADTKNYTPAGSVSAPAITLNPTTASVYSITGAGTLPTLTTNVSNETLTIAFSQGSLPTREEKTVMTGATATASAPKFTGTGVGLTASASYTPAGSVSVASATAGGTVSKPTFSGTSGTVSVS
jgi:hypothetical protein